MFSFLPEMIAGFIGASFYNHAEEKNMPIKWIFVSYFLMMMLMSLSLCVFSGKYEQRFLLFALKLSFGIGCFGAGVAYLSRKCKEKVEQDKRNKQAELAHDRTNEK